MEDTSKETISNGRWITRLMRPYWKEALFAIIVVIVRSTILLAPPLITKELIDSVLPKQDGFRLIVYTIGIAMIPIVNGGLIILELKLSRYILKLGATLRADILNGLQYRPLNWFSSIKTGDLMQRALDETKELTMFAYQGFSSTIWYLMTTIVGLIIMFTLHWKITLIVLIILVIQTYTIQRLGNIAATQSKQIAQLNSGVMEQFRETVAGALFIKTNGTEEHEAKVLSNRLEEHYNGYKRYILIDGAVDFLQVLFVGLVNGILYLGGALFVVNGELTVGSMIALVAIYTWVQPMLASYFIMYIYAKKMSPLLNRVRQIIFPVKKAAGQIKLTPPIDIQATNIYFNYSAERQILKGVNFYLPAGKTMAIIGPSGTGKSTISDLILRLLTPQSGEIRLGGVLIEELEETWLRRNVRCVTQDVQLRSGTLLDNILYPDSHASQEDIEEALQLSGLHEWVEKQPLGLHTEIGEEGMQLSGGERQRLSILRTILSKPAILILDEATSALDNITESQIIQNIYNFLPDTTIIFITHRMSVLEYSDIVFRLKEGHLVREK
ncbi:ABC transporter ATP-binding protein [Bacillus thuringiensis]|uniref:ABC transporter ATP-binding protein n=1 Tax=Bacillus thuringiensis TaxID=1428 RepID=UPI00159711F1|nr:ABC transporter ATP-binding protein [Bacillus thuringiensis]